MTLRGRNINNFIESQNIMFNFSTFFIGECWGLSMLIFEVWLMKLKCLKLLNLLCIIIKKKILILQPNRVVYFRSFYYETPCTTGHHPKIFTTFLQNSQSGQKVGLFFANNMRKAWKINGKQVFFFSSQICAITYFYRGKISFPEKCYK